MRIEEAEKLVNERMTDTDKLLMMMEALHDYGKDRLIELMKRDLDQNGIEND